MFPFTIRYSKKFEKKVPLSLSNEIMNYINEFILQKTGEDIVVEGNKVSYRSGYFKFPSYNVLVPVNGGSFTLEFYEEGCRINYEFSTYKLFIYNAVISLLVGITSFNPIAVLFVFAVISLVAWLIAIIRHRLMLGELVFDIEILILEKKEKENDFLQAGELDYRLPGAVDWTPEDGEWKREGGDWTPDLNEEK